MLEKAGIPAGVVDATDRNHGGINQWFGREEDVKVMAKRWGFLEPLAKAE